MKKRLEKRFVSLILAIVMLLNMLSLQVFAANQNTEKDQVNVVLVTSAEYQITGFDTWIDIEENTTILECIKAAFEEMETEYTIYEGKITELNGKDCSEGDWFISLNSDIFEGDISEKIVVKDDAVYINYYSDKEQEANRPANEIVFDLIASIGTVTVESENKIKEAREKYNRLSDEEKGLVTNYSLLEAAESEIINVKGFLDKIILANEYNPNNNQYYEYELFANLSVAEKGYNVVIPETEKTVSIAVSLSELVPEDAEVKVTIEYKHLRAGDVSYELKFDNGYYKYKNNNGKVANLTGVVDTNGGKSTVTLKIDVDGTTHEYMIEPLRSNPRLNSSGINIKDEKGNAVALNESFDRWNEKKVYTAETSSEKVVITAVPQNKTGSTVYFNGNTDGEITLDSVETEVIITVNNDDGYSLNYKLVIYRKGEIKTSFETDPASALVFVTDKFNTRIWPSEDGNYYLLEGETYNYTVTENGYISENGKLTVKGENNYKIKLEKAPVSKLNILTANWPSFGFSPENNISIKYPTPTALENTALYWAAKIGSGYGSGATGVPIIVDNYLYTYAGTKIVKIDKISGEIVATGKMLRNSSFAINSPTYAEGMLFVGLSNGGIQAFNAETLESLWIYEDVLGGQPNAQIAYNDGYIYTGFWNEESEKANFVCVSVTDEDPNDTDEKKYASWTYTYRGGFYWAGAYVNGDYVYVGTDDGKAGYITGYGHLLSFNKKTGELIDDWTMENTGDIRSSITYCDGKLYFTSKGGYFYEAEFEKETGKITAIRGLKLDNGYEDPENPPMSTSTPTVHNGRAYIGVSGIGQFSEYSGHNITVIDIDNWEIAYTVATQGYPQTTGTLTTYYENATGSAYVYFFDNYTPGKLRVLVDKPGQTEPHETITEKSADGKEYQVAPYIFAPTGSLAQYCICTPVIDADGTLYFKNDSAYIMAVGSAIDRIEVTKEPDKMKYNVGEVFDPAGMEVTAYYVNGTQRDVTKYVVYSKEPLTEEDSAFQIRFEQVGSDKIPYDIIELSFDNNGIIQLQEVKKNTTKKKISLTDTIKLDGSIEPGVSFVNKAAGGVFYVAVISDFEYDSFEIKTAGSLSGQVIDFDPEKYRSTGKETYSVYNTLDMNEEIKGGKNLKTYDQALKVAEKLNKENKTTTYKVKCDQFLYVAKITVPKNYGVSHRSGTYKLTATADGIEYASAVFTVVSDVSIFEYEYVKHSAEYKIALEAQSEEARGYSDYLKSEYGYTYEKAYENQLPTVVSTTAFRAVEGKGLNIQCGSNVVIKISEVAKNQKGVNFIFNNPTGTLETDENDSTKKTVNYSLTFYGTQPIMSDYVIEWDLGSTYFELRKNMEIPLEENDIITYYITKEGKYFDEFTVDYATADYNENIVIEIKGEAGTSLGSYKITTAKPAGAEEEVNPNTGAF